MNQQYAMKIYSAPLQGFTEAVLHYLCSCRILLKFNDNVSLSKGTYFIQ